jgi:hypothetical protein
MATHVALVFLMVACHAEADETASFRLRGVTQKLLDASLRVSLVRNAKSSAAFVTFYFGPTIINGQQVTKTYRVVFQRNDGQWVRV